VKKRRKNNRAKGDGSALPLSPGTLPIGELAGLLDDVRATVIALLATLQVKEADLRKRLRTEETAGIRTGLSDIRLFRHWADRTLRTIGFLERGQQQGDLRALLAELGEFADILHAHDAEQEEQPPESS
jgi:hypothetical protein